MSAQSQESTTPSPEPVTPCSIRPRSVHFAELEPCDASTADVHPYSPHLTLECKPTDNAASKRPAPAVKACIDLCPPVLTITPATPPTTLLLLPLTLPSPVLSAFKPASEASMAARPIAAYSGLPPLPQPDAYPSPFQLPPAVTLSSFPREFGGVAQRKVPLARPQSILAKTPAGPKPIYPAQPSIPFYGSPSTSREPASPISARAALPQDSLPDVDPLFTPLAAHLSFLHPNTPRPVIQYITHQLLSSSVPMGHDGDWEPVHEWDDGMDLSVAGLGMEGAPGLRRREYTEGRKVDGKLEEMYEAARKSWVLMDTE